MSAYYTGKKKCLYKLTQRIDFNYNSKNKVVYFVYLFGIFMKK